MRSLKWRATRLRRLGWSYNVIAGRLGVGKSTLSHWLREVPYEPNQAVIRRIRLGPAKAAAGKQRAKADQINGFRESGRHEIGALSSRDLLMVGLGLYMGEGSRTCEDVRLVNSDPQVIVAAMAWLRRSCHVPVQHFGAVTHIYPDTSPAAAKRYWSHVTGIPPHQFERPQIDRRQNKSVKKRRQLPYGTLHIKVYSRGDSRFGVALHRRIMGWLGAVHEQLAGVV